MAIRINNAKNFAGQKYATEPWVSQQITEAAASALKTVGKLSNNSVVFTEVGGTTQTLDLSALVTSANKGIVVSHNQLTLTLDKTANGQTSKYLKIDSNNGLTVIGIDGAIAAKTTVVAAASGSPITVAESAIEGGGKTYTLDLTVDGKTVLNNSGTLKSGLTLVKLASATSGFAASYELHDSAGTKIGDTIDIVKDQYLKSAVFGWFTKSGDVYSPAQKGDAGALPCLKIEVWTNTDGADNNDAIATTIYIEVTDLFNPYEAGNGLALNGNEFSVAIASDSEKVTTALGKQSDVLSSTASGVKAANIQTAINYAVATESAALKTAINTAKPVALTEVTVSIPDGGSFTGTVWTSSAISGRVISVSDAEGVIYPEIKYTTTTNGVTTTTLSADFGTATPTAETWTCVVANPITLA